VNQRTEGAMRLNWSCVCVCVSVRSGGTARQGGRWMGEVTTTATGMRISGSLEALPSDTLGPVAFVRYWSREAA